MSRKLILGIVVFLLLLATVLGVGAYRVVYGINTQNNAAVYVYIPTAASFAQVVDSLKQKNIIQNETTFRWVADAMKYPSLVKAGKYRIAPHMSNRALLQKLRLGEQEPVSLVINNIRFTKDFVHIVDSLTEIQTPELDSLLHDNTYLAQFGFDSLTVKAMFLPDTYQIFWNTTADAFMQRMYGEYKKFWTPENIALAEKQKLTPYEVISLAAIVEEETVHDDEMPEVAGVYINRLKKNRKLEADPTVKYAVGDFGLRRILHKHLEYDSPYNTYMYEGLPPGPIRFSSKKAINSVLHASDHNYMYFCARDDFSQYHNFAVTYEQHQLNALRYRKALNARNIR
ncbi:MAG: endolytic transglycosylase MltG [Bacteroidetes bacterium]|nr:endolytic transglycosylase MltG [Bacteroidota bacterium]MCB9043032.1 endolytic transglycosylase MltG [Chitinophagales bacterium]